MQEKRRQEAGEKGENYAIFRSQKNSKRWEPTNTGWEPGLKGTGSERIKSTKCGLADLVHIGVEISALNRFTTLN